MDVRKKVRFPHRSLNGQHIVRAGGICVVANAGNHTSDHEARVDRMAELYAGRPAPEPLGEEAESELRTIAKRAIEADLRLADEMEAA